MYTSYWNIRNPPFLNVVNKDLVFETEQHQEGLARMMYLVEQRHPAGMITGPFGIGKSFTLAQVRQYARERELPTIQIDAIPGGSIPMARHILRRLGIEQDYSTLPELLMLLQSRVQSGGNSLSRHLLLIDEAHHLAVGDGFYLVHYLTNLRLNTMYGPETPLFTIILAGIDELRQSLTECESLRRRLQLDWRIAPLSEHQTGAYIQHHMRSEGGDIWTFTNEALAHIYRLSEGIPRSINILCDTALMLGFSGNLPRIDANVIKQAADDTGISDLSGGQGRE